MSHQRVGELIRSAFSSFPDTSLFSEGSIQFSFKIRHIPPDPSSLTHPEPPSPMPDRFDNPISTTTPLLTPTGTRTKADEYRQWDEKGREWLYGYVWFEQKKDPTIVRGYMQVGHASTVADARNHSSYSHIYRSRLSLPRYWITLPPCSFPTGTLRWKRLAIR